MKIHLVGRSVFTEGSTRCGCVSIFLVYPLWLCLAWSEKYDIKAMIHFECNVTIPVVTAHALAARVEGKVPARAESKIGRDRQKLSNVLDIRRLVTNGKIPARNHPHTTEFCRGNRPGTNFAGSQILIVCGGLTQYSKPWNGPARVNQ